MYRDTYHAVLAQVHAQAAEAAGVRRDHGTQPGEHAHHGRGARGRFGQVQAAGLAVRVVGQVHLDLCRVPVHLDAGAHFQPVGKGAGNRIMPAGSNRFAGWQAPDGIDHQALAVIEPFGRVRSEFFPIHLPQQFKQFAFTDPCGAQQGEEVAVPQLGHPDPDLRHAQHVLPVPVVFLYLHAGKYQCAFFVNVPRRRRVCGGHRVPAVCKVRLGDDGEAVPAGVIHNGDEYGPVRRMGISVVGRIVQVGVAAPQLRVEAHHPLRHQVRAAHDVDRQALSHGQHFVVGGQDATGKIPRRVQDGRACGTQQGIGHRPHDTVEAVVQQGKLMTVQRMPGFIVFHGSPVKITSPWGKSAGIHSRCAPLPSGHRPPVSLPATRPATGRGSGARFPGPVPGVPVCR